MRIGLITPAWPGGDKANGITTAVAHMAAGLDAIGHTVTIIPIEPAAESEPLLVNLPPPRNRTFIERLNGRLGRDIASGPILIERLIQAARLAIDRNMIEVLIVEETQGWAGPLQKALKIPVVVTLHGPWFLVGPLASARRQRAIDRGREKREGIALATCAGVTAPSQDVLDKTLARYGLKDRPSAVIRNPMPAGPPLDHTTLSEHARRSILFVGRFDHLKGGDVLLEAFNQTINQNLDAQLRIVGPDRGLKKKNGRNESIFDAIASLPRRAQARIKYEGPLDRAKIANLRAQHAIAVIASRYENLSYAMLESLAAGAATICTAVGGHAEVIRDGETGILIPPGDPIAMAAAFQRLLEDPTLAAQLGTAAHREITEVFAPAQIASEMAAFLESVLASHRAERI